MSSNCMQFVRGPWSVGRFIGVTVLLLTFGAEADAQFYGTAGGVGRYFDPGRLSGTGGPREIGGMQRVSNNPIAVSLNPACARYNTSTTARKP